MITFLSDTSIWKIKETTNSLPVILLRSRNYIPTFLIWPCLWCFGQLNVILCNIWAWASRALQFPHSYLEHTFLEATCHLSCQNVLRPAQCVEDQNSHVEEEKHWTCQAGKWRLLKSSRPTQPPAQCKWVMIPISATWIRRTIQLNLIKMLGRK